MTLRPQIAQALPLGCHLRACNRSQDGNKGRHQTAPAKTRGAKAKHRAGFLRRGCRGRLTARHVASTAATLAGLIAPHSKPEVAQPGVIVWPAPERPMKLAFVVADGQVVDRGVPRDHESIVVKLPIFIAVRPEPVPVHVVAFIGKSDRDPIALVGPELLDQSVFQLARRLRLRN